MMAQTMPTMAPAQRVVAPDSSSRRQAFIDNDPPKPPSTDGEQIGETVRAELLVEIGGFLARDFEARNVEQKRDRHDAAKRADLGAALRDHAPIDLVPDHGAEGPPQTQLAEARQEPGAARRLVADDAEQAGIEDDEKAEEGERQRKVGGHPSRPSSGIETANRTRDENLRPVERRVKQLPNSTAEA